MFRFDAQSQNPYMKSTLWFLALFLVSTQIFGQVNLNQGLLAYYPFNGNADDASGNGNKGVAQNGAFLTTDFQGKASSAAGFDGVNDFILVTDNGKLNADA